jgi:hypothetical protein
MNEIQEVGCKKCGSSLIRVDTTPVSERGDPPPMNQCENCGYHNPFQLSFYWPADLHALVTGLWRDVDMNAFRLNPASYVEDHLNPWLAQQNRGRARLEGPDASRHIVWER